MEEKKKRAAKDRYRALSRAAKAKIEEKDAVVASGIEYSLKVVDIEEDGPFPYEYDGGPIQVYADPSCIMDTTLALENSSAIPAPPTPLAIPQEGTIDKGKGKAVDNQLFSSHVVSLAKTGLSNQLNGLARGRVYSALYRLPPKGLGDKLARVTASIKRQQDSNDSNT
ncbi:hypothetical protein V493_03594 [Pseudogymnoascus sp. VKM F-4281 (FW-2241)]|nr:hypothetical protein V493_03594 [Pseudogymnoascus sp. VKM F-4281 (FW-2241)]